MIQLFHWTYNNHLSCGFHTELSGALNKDIFYSKVAPPSRKSYTAFEEAQIAAILIHKEAKKLNQEIFLCLSSGVDSSAMLKAFLSSGVPFQIMILRFNNNLNFFDIEGIIQFCNQNHLPYEILDLEVLDFFESGKYMEYGKLYQCQSPQLAVHLYLCDHIRGCPVLSWQTPEIFFYFNHESKKKESCFGLPTYLHAVFLRYFVKK